VHRQQLAWEPTQCGLNMSGRFGSMASFPKTATSVREWLQAINLAQYSEAFEAANVELSQLHSLSDDDLKQLGLMEGQKRRLLIALEHLDVGGDSGGTSSIGGVTAAAPQPKYNSTSSLYIDSTISRPCVDEIIFCVSIVIHDRIDEGERELLADPTLVDRMPDMFNTKSKPLLVQLDSTEPTELTIFQSIKSIYSIAEFSAECLVISLLYIERLRSLTGLHLLMQNWQPILLAAMVVAQKVWDDKSLLNVDFSLICSAYSLKDINDLEKAFLEMIKYNVSISASLYASYYFELRTLCEKAERTFSLKPLTEQQQRALETRADQKTDQLGKLRYRRDWKSLGEKQMS